MKKFFKTGWKNFEFQSINIPIFLIVSFNMVMGQVPISELNKSINGIKVEMQTGFGYSNHLDYSFINAGCFCSISQATTGKKERMNSIITFSFNLSNLKKGRILVSKPKDSDYKEIEKDIWALEIGELDILVQNTNWKSQQTNTSHLYLFVNGTIDRDRIIDLFKKAAADCGGEIIEVTILD